MRHLARSRLLLHGLRLVSLCAVVGLVACRHLPPICPADRTAVDSPATLFAQAKALERRGEYVQAATLYGRSAALKEAAEGSDSPSLIVDLYHQAQATLYANNPGGAETLYRRALQLQEHELAQPDPFFDRPDTGPDDDDDDVPRSDEQVADERANLSFLPIILNDLAIIYRVENQPRLAKVAYTRAINIRRKGFRISPINKPSVDGRASTEIHDMANHFHVVAKDAFFENDLALADTCETLALTLYDSTPDAPPADVAQVLFRLAEINRIVGYTDAAERFAERAAILSPTPAP